MAGSYATSSGLMGGADALQNFLAQRKMEEIAAQQAQQKAAQLEFENQIKAQQANAQSITAMGSYTKDTAAPPPVAPSILTGVTGTGGARVTQARDRAGNVVYEVPEIPPPAAEKNPIEPRTMKVKASGATVNVVPDPHVPGGFLSGDTHYGPSELDPYQAPPQSNPDTLAARDQARSDAQATRDAASLERSYQYTNNELNKTATTYADHATKVADALSIMQNPSAVSDALAVPKMLTALVGGQGSGLRMTNSEINNVLHGRTTLEAMQVGASKWLTTGDARSLSDVQRQSMIDLLSASQAKAAKRLGVVRSAQKALSTAGSTGDHKKIYNDMNDQLDALDTGGGSAAPTGGTVSRDAQGNVIIR